MCLTALRTRAPSRFGCIIYDADWIELFVLHVDIHHPLWGKLALITATYVGAISYQCQTKCRTEYQCQLSQGIGNQCREFLILKS